MVTMWSSIKIGSLKKRTRARTDSTTPEDSTAGAELPQSQYCSPLQSPTSVASALSSGPVENARRASEPPNPQTLPSPSQHNARANSAFDVAVRSRSRSSNRAADPLGLTVVYQPETHPPLDIIFVHGLGGTSRATWSKDRNPEFFWPEKWLPTEPAISSTRILSFGYNANFAATGPAPITGIVDFAKDLLYAMKFAKDGEMNELELGKRPIIFIVHSMGGLVVKQAYILGQNDENYSEIVSSVSAILFLATPHRGSDLAEILNRILTVSIFNHSPKLYVGELKHGSPTIQSLNEQFRHIAPKLDILSFYETLQTAVGPKKMMVVEKQSATLGYPAEISKSLIADHHTVCKYDSIYDTNYISIRNALKTLVTTIKSKGHHLLAAHSKPEVERLEILLAVPENYQEDFVFFRKRWTSGTCEWILENNSFRKWRFEPQGSMMLWLNALPASGKSILSSFIINHLLQESFCAFYFFRFGDQVKRSVGTCLRTIVFQLAEQLPRFRAQLDEVRFSTKSLEKADAKTIWTKVFVNIIFKMDFSTIMYWVIDALDESDSPQALVELMQDISKANSAIRVLLVSRRTPELVQTFDRLSIVVPVVSLPFEDTKRDIRAYIEAEVRRYMHATDDFKSQIVERLVSGADGNFLWVSLALVEVLKCNTEEDLDETLEGIPTGMENLYKRMERAIIDTTKPRDQKLGHMILTWSVCSRRPLLLKELSQALQPEFSIMTDLMHIIDRVCSHFVTVDSNGRLVMIHQTARDHITTTNSALAVKVADGHEKIFAKCMSALEVKQPRRYTGRAGSSKVPDYQHFLRYATMSWNYHLNLLSSESDEPLFLLSKFLGSSSVLNWIAYLAKHNILKILVYSSKAMSSYVRRKRNRNTGTNPLQHRIHELDLVESWATDFLKIIGKFGPNLVDSPNSIYHQIPPFCPKTSALFRHYERTSPKPHSLTLKGVSKADWDDSLAKLSLGAGNKAFKVQATGHYIAVATTTGQITRHIYIHDAATFELKRVLDHTENISAMGFSECMKYLATYGHQTTKVWSVDTGRILHEIVNPKVAQAFAIVFAGGDTELMIGSHDRLLRYVDLTVPCPSWIVLHPTLLKDDAVLDRPVHKMPRQIAFSPDRNYIAVAYRNFPLSIWSLDDERPELIGRLMRDKEYAGNSWTVVDQAVWHADSQEVVGIYMGGHIFRWNPFTNVQQEIPSESAVLSCSPDGKFFAIGEPNGTIRLYDYHHFALVYSLSCDTMIRDLCFSPDGKRLYDGRGQYCNVWEPNALIRSDDSGEQDSEERSEVASIPTLAVSEAFADVRDQITAVAIQFHGRYQAIGNEAGVVSIMDTMAKDPHAVQIWQSCIPFAIANLNWSDDGQYLACSELTGRVLVNRFQVKGDDTYTVTPVFDVKVKINGEGIQHVLLNHDGSLLLVKSGSSATLWTVGALSHSAEHSIAIESPETQWLKHPKDHDKLLAISCVKAHIYLWKNVSEIAVVDLISEPLQAHLLDDTIEKLEDTNIENIGMDSVGLRCFLDIVSPTATGSKRFISFTSISALTNAATGGHAVTLDPMPSDLQDHIEIILGVLSKQRLVFLNKAFWVCSVPFGPAFGVEGIQKHYHLPKDWVNATWLEHCALLNDGTLLVPNNGDLAIVACADLSH